MGVMLPGAVELPHDEIIFYIEKLEDENAALRKEKKVLTDENRVLTDEKNAWTDEKISLLNEVERLKERIAELGALNNQPFAE